MRARAGACGQAQGPFAGLTCNLVTSRRRHNVTVVAVLEVNGNSVAHTATESPFTAAVVMNVTL